MALIGQLAGAHNAKTTRQPKKLVVLPFANLGPTGDQYFTDGSRGDYRTIIRHR